MKAVRGRGRTKLVLAVAATIVLTVGATLAVNYYLRRQQLSGFGGGDERLYILPSLRQ